jgi:hypothetical protein
MRKPWPDVKYGLSRFGRKPGFKTIGFVTVGEAGWTVWCAEKRVNFAVLLSVITTGDRPDFWN